MRISIATLFILLAHPSLAAWASGGGKIHRDSSNPWFLENTSVVRYCIDIDETHFGITASNASKEVQAALNDWTTAFQTAKDDYYDDGLLEPFGQVRLGTQSFQEVSCLEDVDVRFQLGRLTAEQLKIFENSSDFIGIAVRTDYDKVFLKGKGFIYLAPTSGPNTPHHPSLHPSAWTAQGGIALKFVLRHELGHIFGVDHQPDSVMDDKVPELLVDKALLDNLSAPARSYLERRYDVFRFLGQKKEWIREGCDSENPIVAKSVFGKPYTEKSCGRISIIGNTLTIEYKEDSQSQYEKVGSSTFASTASSTRQLVSVYLPAEQKVFSKIPDEAIGFRRLYGEDKVVSLEWRGGDLHIDSTGETLPIQIEVNEHETRATVLKNGLFQNNIFTLE